MTGIDVPRRVRIASGLTYLVAPAGLLLVIVGLLELHWFSTPSAARLSTVIAEIKDQFGAGPPELLRGRGGAVELIVIGVLCLACAIAAPLVAKGRRGARAWVLALGIATAVIGLLGIGADSSDLRDLKTYFDTLEQSSDAAPRIPEINALLFPGWYSWLEDIAQGLQVLVSLAAAIAVTIAGIWHPEYFVAKEAETAPPSEWDAAMARIRQKAARSRERE